MGTQLRLMCDCGYEARVSIGGGMANHKTVCDFPHYCATCGVVTANTHDDPVRCPKCQTTDIIRYGQLEGERPEGVDLFEWMTNRPYTWDQRVTDPVGDYSTSWRNLRLTEGNHLCPGCKQMSLKIDRRSIRRFD